MPEKLLPTDFVDLSNKTSQRISLADISWHVPAAERPMLQFSGHRTVFSKRSRFPEHARGFLYLHQKSNDVMKSSIRLRCTRSNDPATFNEAKDLLRPGRLPWEFSMPTILHSRSSYIRDYLLLAGILTERQIIDWQSSQKFPSPRGPHRSTPVISTLKPDELLPSDFIDISYKANQLISFTCNPSTSPSDIPQLTYYTSYGAGFPSHARGFLYYHQPLNMPPIAASVRFRCTPSNDPATFNQGSDLLRLNGLPWDISMPTILHIRSSQIRDYLLHAKIVTEAQMLQWKSVLNGKLIHPYLALYRLDQPFLVRFHSAGLRLTAIVRDFFGHIYLQHIFRDMRGQHIKYTNGTSPYKGLFVS